MLPFCLVKNLVALFESNFAIHPANTYVHFNKEVSPVMWEQKDTFVTLSLFPLL